VKLLFEPIIYDKHPKTLFLKLWHLNNRTKSDGFFQSEQGTPTEQATVI